MNEEENGRDANELHSFGGMKDESPNETKTENEELADAIEELESNEVDESIPDAPKEINEEPKPTMTIDSVENPKAKKGGAGWKVATILFALLAIVSCGGLCYLFFVDGTTNILGRTITSAQTKPATSNKTAEEPKKSEPKTISYEDGIFSIPQWGIELNLGGAKYLSYKYDEDAETISFWLVDPTTAASLTEKPVIDDNTKNTTPIGTLKLMEELDSGNYGSAPELVYTIPSGGYIYYYGPQDFACNYVDESIKVESCAIENAAADFFMNRVGTSTNFSVIK